MNRSDLYQYAIKQAIRHSGHIIEEIVEVSGGDIDAAMDMLGKEFSEYEHETWGQRLGTWGTSGPGNPRVDAFGSARTHPIRVWAPGKTKWSSSTPDLLVPWRDVFEYFVTHTFKPVQLDMFCDLSTSKAGE